VLFVYNDPTAPAALLGDAFAECGFDVDVFNVVPGDSVDNPAVQVSFPAPGSYDVIVPLGARWPVYDEALRATWVGAEMQLVRDAADLGVPVLGVCFGGQLLAQAFGGSVARSPAPEIGWSDVASDDPGLVPGGPWFQWHFDRWTIPPGAIEVARSRSASQAFVLGRALALQFHPELNHELLEVWLADDTDGEITRMGITADELRSRTTELLNDASRRVRELVRTFLANVALAPADG
jgi:GMP synthase-like glutamine amidotransferase